MHFSASIVSCLACLFYLWPTISFASKRKPPPTSDPEDPHKRHKTLALTRGEGLFNVELGLAMWFQGHAHGALFEDRLILAVQSDDRLSRVQQCYPSIEMPRWEEPRATETSQQQRQPAQKTRTKKERVGKKRQSAKKKSLPRNLLAGRKAPSMARKKVAAREAKGWSRPLSTTTFNCERARLKFENPEEEEGQGAGYTPDEDDNEMGEDFTDSGDEEMA